MSSIARTKPDNATLEAHLGYWLRRVSNHISGAFARALQEKDVSVAEWVVLSQIDVRPGVRPAELAGTLGLTRGAVSKVLDKLEEKKCITRRTLEADNRGLLLSLTQRGRRVLPELREIADGNDRRFFNDLDAKEKATLGQLLRKLAAIHEIRNVPVE